MSGTRKKDGRVLRELVRQYVELARRPIQDERRQRRFSWAISGGRSENAVG